jgi:membrane associated rhomboid family serine protease
MPPVTQALIIANVAVFLLEMAGGMSFLSAFALWPPASGAFAGPQFQLWQLVTYSFLHANAALTTQTK